MGSSPSKKAGSYVTIKKALPLICQNNINVDQISDPNGITNVEGVDNKDTPVDHCTNQHTAALITQPEETAQSQQVPQGKRIKADKDRLKDSGHKPSIPLCKVKIYEWLS